MKCTLDYMHAFLMYPPSPLDMFKSTTTFAWYGYVSRAKPKPDAFDSGTYILCNATFLTLSSPLDTFQYPRTVQHLKIALLWWVSKMILCMLKVIISSLANYMYIQSLKIQRLGACSRW